LKRVRLKPFLLLVHYWFPVALGWSWILVVHHATQMPIWTPGSYLYLVGIGAAYSLDRLVDNQDSLRPAWLHAALIFGFVFSTIAGFFLAFKLPPQTFSLLLLISVITLLYFKLKKLPFAKGFLVAIVWAWAGVAFPFADNNWFAWQFWTMPISIPFVLLMTCNVILCDFKDIKTDSVDEVYSLPVMLGPRGTLLVVSLFLLVAAGVSYKEHLIGLVISSGLLFLLAWQPRLLSLDAIGPLIVDAALTLPGVLIALHLISGKILI